MNEEKTGSVSVSHGGRTDIETLIEELPIDEKRAATQALALVRGELAEAALFEVLWARHRTEQRRRSDRATDAQRRRLVGARVPRELAERCKWVAESQGISLNAWVTKALKNALQANEPKYETPQKLTPQQRIWEIQRAASKR